MTYSWKSTKWCNGWHPLPFICRHTYSGSKTLPLLWGTHCIHNSKKHMIRVSASDGMVCVCVGCTAKNLCLLIDIVLKRLTIFLSALHFIFQKNFDFVFWGKQKSKYFFKLKFKQFFDCFENKVIDNYFRRTMNSWEMSNKTNRTLRAITPTNTEFVETEDKVQFKRQIKLINGIAIVVGTIIGSGIFVSPKGVYGSSNCSLVGSLVVWGLCGLFSMLGSLCYAEMGTTITRSGGDYAYIYEGFGPFFAYLNLWISIIVIRPTTQAIMALTFANYILGPFYPSTEPGCTAPDMAIRMLAAIALCE